MAAEKSLEIALKADWPRTRVEAASKVEEAVQANEAAAGEVLVGEAAAGEGVGPSSMVKRASRWSARRKTAEPCHTARTAPQCSELKSSVLGFCLRCVR